MLGPMLFTGFVIGMPDGLDIDHVGQFLCSTEVVVMRMRIGKGIKWLAIQKVLEEAGDIDAAGLSIKINVNEDGSIYIAVSYKHQCRRALPDIKKGYAH